MALETAAFAGDRLSRRSLRRFLTRPTADLLVADAGGLVGYVLTLFRAGSGTGRIYSLAVRSDRRGRGVGRALMAAAIDGARRRGRLHLTLEVRADNPAGEGLYRGLGFVPLRELPAYYEDGAAGRRLGLRLAPRP